MGWRETSLEALVGNYKTERKSANEKDKPKQNTERTPKVILPPRNSPIVAVPQQV